MVNLKELVNTNGLMVNFTKENGLTDLNMVLVCGKVPNLIAMLVNGVWVRQRAMEYMCGLMEIAIRESLKIV